MNTSELITEIDAEMDRLRQARALLSGSENGMGRHKRKYTLSPEARARISAAQKKEGHGRRERRSDKCCTTSYFFKRAANSFSMAGAISISSLFL